MDQDLSPLAQEIEERAFKILNKNVTEEDLRYMEQIPKEKENVGFIMELIDNSGEPAIAKFCILLLKKTIQMNWENYEDQEKASITEWTCHKLHDAEIKHIASDILNVIYDLGYNNFSSLTISFESLLSNSENIDTIADIISYLPPNLLESHVSTLIEYAIQSLSTIQKTQISLKLVTKLLNIGVSPDSLSEYAIGLTSTLSDALNNHSTDLSRIWHPLSIVFMHGVITNDILTQIFDYASNETVPPQSALSALQSLESVTQSLSEAQIMTLINICITLGIKIECETPEDSKAFIDPLSPLFKHYPHSTLYSILKPLCQICIESGHAVPCLHIVLLLAREAPELIISDIAYHESIILNSLSVYEENIVWSVVFLLDELYLHNSASSIIQKSVKPLISFIPLAHFELQHDIIKLLTKIFEVNVFNTNEAMQSLWSLKIDNNLPIVSLLGQCLTHCDDLSDSFLAEVHAYTNTLDHPSKLTMLSSLLKVDESMTMESVTQSQDSLWYCLKQGEEEVKIAALNFIGSVSSTFRKESATFLSQYLSSISRLLRGRKRKSIQAASLRAGAHLVRYCGLDSLLKPLIASLTKCYQSHHPDVLVDAMGSHRLLVKMMSGNVARIFYGAACDICTQGGEEVVSVALEVMKAHIKHADTENLPVFLETASELIVAFFEGTIPSIKGLLDDNADYDLHFINEFSLFVSTYMTKNPPNSDEICRLTMSLVKREHESYRDVPVLAFIGGMESGSVSNECIQEFLEYIPIYMEKSSTDATRQNIVYLFILLVDNYPGIAGSISGVLDNLSVWGREGDEGVQSNIASLVLKLAALGIEIDYSLVEEAAEQFPPTDDTETISMYRSLKKIIGSMSDEAEKSYICGLAKILTDKEEKISRIGISADLKEDMISTLREMCGAKLYLLEAARDSVSHSKIRSNRLNELLK